jgi:predicted permease
VKRLKALLFRRRLDRDLKEELAFHFDMAERELRADGISAEEAHYEARRRFGNGTRIRERSREIFSFVYLEALWRDLQYGCRGLRRNRVMAAVGIVSLAAGIGANTTAYSLIDSLILHDVTAREPERLVRFNGLSYPNYRELRATSVFDGLAAFSPASLNWRQGEESHSIFTLIVTANFFELLGAEPAIGRVFTESDARAEKDPRVVVLGYRFWERYLNGDPHAVGRALNLNGSLFTVVAVMPKQYRSIMGLGISPDAFLPMGAALKPRMYERTFSMLIPVGRLLHGRTREQTRDALTAALRGLEEAYPDDNRNLGRPQPLIPATGLDRAKAMSGDAPLLFFSGILSCVVAVLLLIACANVAGLLLARAAGRQREIAIRLALGAGRGRLFQQFLIESAILAAAGCALGIVLTFWAASAFARIRLPIAVPVGFTFVPNVRLLAFTAALGFLATFLCGLAPALGFARPRLASDLTARSASAMSKLRLRSFLVAGQIAACAVLLIAALLFLQNLHRIVNTDPGFDTAHTITVSVQPNGAAENTAAMRDEMRGALQNAPGVEAVSSLAYFPLNWEYWEPRVRRADGPATSWFHVYGQPVGPGYLATMRIPLIAGREFYETDLRNRGDNPALINETFAREHFGALNPVGRVLKIDRGRGIEGSLIIVGVARNTKFRSLGNASVPLLYTLESGSQYIVRTAGPPTIAAASLRRAILTANPSAAVTLKTAREYLEMAVWPAKFGAVLLGVVAVAGLTLALVGLCGVVIYNVARRTQEIGIRVALGATATDILRLMLREAVVLIGSGLIAGLVISIFSARSLERLLADGLNPSDPLILIAAILVLIAACLLAMLVPCRRALRVDPAVSLRCE